MQVFHPEFEFGGDGRGERKGAPPIGVAAFAHVGVPYRHRPRSYALLVSLLGKRKNLRALAKVSLRRRCLVVHPDVSIAPTRVSFRSAEVEAGRPSHGRASCRVPWAPCAFASAPRGQRSRPINPPHLLSVPA